MVIAPRNLSGLQKGITYYRQVDAGENPEEQWTKCPHTRTITEILTEEKAEIKRTRVERSLSEKFNDMKTGVK